MAEKVSNNEVIAFRLGMHHLGERLGDGGLLDAAGRCGVQNSPPGSALLALHARVHGVTRELVDRALGEEKTLLHTWCMRGAPFYIPAADAPVFTTGVLPPTEETARHFIPGVVPAVDRLGMSLTEAVELTGAGIRDVLSGRRLAIGELGAELAERIARKLPQNQRAIWQEEGPYAPGQPLGEAVVHFCIRILTLQRVVCFAPRAGNKAPFVLADEWLGHPIPAIDQEAARAELLRRYLHSYGPSTRADFAAWLGIRAGDTEPWWSPVAGELTQVEAGRTSWILTEDLAALRSQSMPEGVRLLPPRDPYSQLRDRNTIVDRKFHREVWKMIGDPGTVLAGGRIAGTWRPRRSGRRLIIAVKTFEPMPGRIKEGVQDEAEQIAPLRDASSVEVEFDTY